MEIINFKLKHIEAGFRFTSFGSNVDMERLNEYEGNYFYSAENNQYLFKVEGNEWSLYRGILYDSIVESDSSLLMPQEMIKLILEKDRYN